MNGSTSVGKRVRDLQIGPEFNTYTMVIIHAGQITDNAGNTTDLDYIAGNTAGRTMEITDPMGSQAKANALLAKLQNSKWQYQPYTAQDALLDPAAELGDGLTVSDTFSAVYRREVDFSALMATKLVAPSDEEIDHEYPYIPKEDRVYKRETQFTRSQLKINANSITSEIENRIAAVNGLDTKLTSKIEQTAASINAEVSRVDEKNLDHTRSNSSFGWKLTSDGFYLNANGNKNVFTCTKDGIIIQGNATVTGKIQATSGYIGSTQGNGLTITSKGMYSGSKSSLENGQQGVYVGSDGISLGAINGMSAFKVTSNGAVTARNLAIEGGSINMKDSGGTTVFKVTTGGDVEARNMKLTGTLKIDGNNITAANLYTGASQAASKYSSWDTSTTTVTNNSSNWSSGYTYGKNWNDTQSESTSSRPSIYIDNISAKGNISAYNGTMTAKNFAVGNSATMGICLITDKSGNTYMCIGNKV